MFKKLKISWLWNNKKLQKVFLSASAASDLAFPPQRCEMRSFANSVLYLVTRALCNCGRHFKHCVILWQPLLTNAPQQFRTLREPDAFGIVSFFPTRMCVCRADDGSAVVFFLCTFFSGKRERECKSCMHTLFSLVAHTSTPHYLQHTAAYTWCHRFSSPNQISSIPLHAIE